MEIDGKVLFVTGANRGIGNAIVRRALTRKVKKIYATTRQKEVDFSDPRVVWLSLDVTDKNSVQRAGSVADDVNLLINNAGSLSLASLINGSIDDLRQDMEVNFFGTLHVTRCLFPIIAKNGGGVATISSMVGLAGMAGIGGYSASKAAISVAIQSIRAEVCDKGIQVFAVFPGAVETDMTKPFLTAKASAMETAENILQGIESDEEDIFPDPLARKIAAMWRDDPKSLERFFRSF